MANAYVRMRHPDYDALRGMLDDGGPHPARVRLVRVTLLGPQRRPTLDTVAASLYPEGPVATITAGWQEREPDDDELEQAARLPRRQPAACTSGGWTCRSATRFSPRASAGWPRCSTNCRTSTCCASTTRCRRCTPSSAAATPAGCAADVLAEAIDAVRDLDAAHLRRVGAVRGEFYPKLPPHDRPVIAEHRAEVAALLGDAAAVVIAGGHVGVLADALHLFNVAASLRSAVIAWSAGAMALAERIVLFHDRSAHGPGHPEIYGSGLSVFRNVVPLPHARARLLLEDAPRMAVFARRFAPARCVLLENGTRMDTDERRHAARRAPGCSTPTAA